MHVSVVIPVYNEEGAVRQTVLEMKEALDGLGFDYEIVIVDDASVDSSIQRVLDLDVKIIRHPVNLGGGAARVSGMRFASGDIILQTDADGTYPTDQVSEIISEMADHDMVIGARRSEQGAGWGPLRVLMKWLIKRTASYLCGTRIPDLNTGMRAYRRDAALEYEFLYPDSHSIMSTMTLAFLMDKRRVKFVEIDYRPRIGKSSFHPLRDTMNYILATTRAITHFNPFRITTLISFVILAVAVVFLCRDLYYLDIADITVFSFITSTIVFLFGVAFDQISTVRRGMLLELRRMRKERALAEGRGETGADDGSELIKA